MQKNIHSKSSNLRESLKMESTFNQAEFAVMNKKYEQQVTAVDMNSAELINIIKCM